MPSALMLAGDEFPPQLPRLVAAGDDEVVAEYQRELWRAKCRDMDPEAFHPAPRAGRRTLIPAQVQADAEFLCAGCPITPVCLEYGLRLQAKSPKSHQEGAIWGGTSKYLRKAILEARAAAAEAVTA